LYHTKYWAVKPRTLLFPPVSGCQKVAPAASHSITSSVTTKSRYQRFAPMNSSTWSADIPVGPVSRSPKADSNVGAPDPHGPLKPKLKQRQNVMKIRPPKNIREKYRLGNRLARQASASAAVRYRVSIHLRRTGWVAVFSRLRPHRSWLAARNATLPGDLECRGRTQNHFALCATTP